MTDSEEAAVRWCKENDFRWYSYLTPENRSYGLPGLPAGPGGDLRWLVWGGIWGDRLGWTWIQKTAPTLAEAVEKVQIAITFAADQAAKKKE